MPALLSVQFLLIWSLPSHAAVHTLLPSVFCCCPVLQECAVLDLVATVLEEQGKGHCSALLGAVEGWLGPKLGVRNLMAVCPGDVSSTLFGIGHWLRVFRPQTQPQLVCYSSHGHTRLG